MAIKQELKQGDIVVCEGDLFQRVYTVASGKVALTYSDRTITTLGEGELFGFVSFLNRLLCVYYFAL